MIAPVIEELARKAKGKVVFLKVDVDENAETAEWAGIEAMPTFKFYKNKAQVDELVGASEQALKDKIESNK